MSVRKVIAGSVLAAGLGAAGMVGAGTAFAGPGISYDDGSGAVGLGDNSSEGAQASATKGNRALAISLVGRSRADAIGGANNNSFAFDGGSFIGPGGGDDPQDTNVFTSYGISYVNGTRGVTVINAGGATLADGTESQGEVSVQFCGTRLSAQSDHIVTNKNPGSGTSACI